MLDATMKEIDVLPMDDDKSLRQKAAKGDT